MLHGKLPQTQVGHGNERIAPGAGKQAFMSWIVRPSLHLTVLTSFKPSPFVVPGRSTVRVVPPPYRSPEGVLVTISFSIKLIG